MVLSLNQIKEILLKPKNRETIKKASLMQHRLRFHTETNIAISDINMPTNQFLLWVSNFLPKDKYNIFLNLFRFPLSTPAVVEDVYRELERVFYSRNSSFTYQFTSAEMLEDWLNYKKSNLNEPDVWKTKGWRQMQVSPNSVLIVDLPVLQSTLRPEPYFYWLEIEDVIDYETHDGMAFEWLIIKQPNNRIGVFDDDSIRVYQLNEKNEISAVISEAYHHLGFCTARFYWSTSLNEKNKDIKKNPITKELSNLDWYLFFSLSKQHLDLYAPYPIYSAYAADCNFENNATGDYCDGGFLRNAKGEYKILGDGTIEKCPCCSEKRIAGPGSFLEVPVPNSAEGIADMRNPIQITSIDKDSLDYNVDECVRLRNDIIFSIVGYGGNTAVSEKEAINETQVAANFESKTSVLNALKTNFEQAQKFVEDTVCKLRYGNSFISSSINWGTEFYVFTIEELYKKYETAKANGAAESELDAITQQILEVEYRNNPLVLQRMLILKQLEPYPHKTLSEVIQLYDKGLLDLEKVKIKINFSSYIERFERENIDIVSFGSNATMNEKISTIYTKLLDYAKQEQTTTPARAESSAGAQAKAPTD